MGDMDMLILEQIIVEHVSEEVYIKTDISENID
jgi:hypothetical protein